jgi:hypothetical protein
MFTEKSRKLGQRRVDFLRKLVARKPRVHGVETV